MAQIPFSPPQVQAALQNPVRFPDQQLQQYAQRGSPTGQVTPPMAQQEMATRGQERQAFQRQQAMSQNPENSPTIFQQKDMQIQQAMQALQQKEQQLGMMGALMARKAQDVQEREQGIATLPVREDMFTAMNGGIVFRGGGQVQRFNGRKGPSFIEGISPEFGGVSSDVLIEDIFRAEKKKKEKDKVQYEFLQEAAPSVAKRFAEENPHVLETIPRVPSTVGEPEPTIYKPSTNKKEDRKSSSTTGETRAPSLANLTTGMYDKYMSRMSPYMGTSPEVSESRSGIRGALGRISNEAEKSKPLEGRAREEMETAERERLAKEYGEYTAGRTSRRERAAEALRGQKLELIDYLGAMAEGGPGKTLAETLSRAVPGTTKLRADQKAREMAAAKFLAEAEELDAKADLAERRGQTIAARQLTEQADQRRARSFEIVRGAEATNIQGLGALASSAEAEQKRIADIASTGAAAELKGNLEVQLKQAEMNFRAALEANRPTDMMRNAQFIANATGKPMAEVVNSLLTKGRSSVKTADPAKALETINALPFNNPMLVSRAALTQDEMLKVQRSKNENELPPAIVKKLTRAKEAMYQQMVTGAADDSLFD